MGRKAIAVAVIWALTAPVVSFGDPPPWAPAHGWRAKHDPFYLGYTGKKWDRDFGVLDGRCNRSAVKQSVRRSPLVRIVRPESISSLC
ncbi:MAG: hypothetical protein Q8Q58_11465 [Candidatus Rokubacteria bacterium]|nr:hypothetical protein [Candidatus Rokubacteria bacterium]